MTSWSAFRFGMLLLHLWVGMALVGCGAESRQETEPDAAASRVPPALPSIRVVGAGFSTPESVLHDAEADVYLVSNINGGPRDLDGNGFISRLSPRGQVLSRAWIDGSLPGVTLNGPKGMAILGDTLFVADVDCLRRFHRTTGEPLGDLCLDGAFFLNDVASAPGGRLYFTETGGAETPGAVYLLRPSADVPQTVILADGTVLDGAEMGGPNGVFADERGLYLATYGSGELHRIAPDGTRERILPPSELGLDGVTSTAEGAILVSSWGDSAVYRVETDGTLTPVLEDVESPADIGFDRARSRVLVPLFGSDAVIIQEVR